MEVEKENMIYKESEGFCTCVDCMGITSGYEDSFGFWDVCIKCGKRIEDGYHYYNHFDGEDHIDYDMID